MERALDPELLNLALGDHEALPSPEEISELLAEAELALLLRSPEVTESLIGIGWYLHAVASSKYALQTYGVERQRAAFQVAGHIFDLLLETPDLDRMERLKYCFAAQIAYLRSALDPNALAMYRREFADDLNDLGLLSHFREVAISCGIALLGFDAGYIYDVTRNIRNEVENLVAEWAVDDIISTPFAAAAYVASGSRNLMSFLVYGRSNLLERARGQFQSAVLADASAEDQISRWVAAHLLNLSNGLESSSIWTALPPDVPPNIRKAFAMGNPRVLTLWPPQLNLFNAGGEETENPLSPEMKRLFISTPTSGGKTLLAQLLVTSHLTTEQTSVCYVAPTRSLCREVRKSLESRLRFVGKEIADGLPEGVWWDILLDFEPEVEVMTPERLSYLLRSDSSRVLEKFGMFIFDEVHLVGEPDRGWTLEEDLTFLHYMTQDTGHRLILMSAAVGNRNHLVSWMGEEGNGVIHRHSEWRGPRRLHAIWTTTMDRNKGRIEPTRSKKYPRRINYPLHGRLDVRISHTGKIHSLQTKKPIGNLAQKISVRGRREKDGSNSTPFYQMIIPIIQHLGQSGPVLVIESTRRNTVLMAKAIADGEEAVDLSAVQTLKDLVETRLGADHPLWEILEKGVVYHHGSLPGEIREAIEEAVSEGVIRYLVATTTMTEGVNLPVKSVVIASQGSHGKEGYVEYITGSKLLNAIGRAGRATKETEGVVVLARNARPAASDFERLNPDDSEIEVISVLATHEALEALAAFEDLQRGTEDAILQMASGVVSGFIQFIWFIAATFEQLGELYAEERIRDILAHTLAWVQLSPEDRDRWLKVVEDILAYYDETDPSTRQRWASAGTSISSASELEKIAQEITESLEGREIPQDPLEVVDLVTNDGRIERILALPEAPTTRIYTQRAGKNREEIVIPVGELLRDWLQGAELTTLADNYFGTISNIDYRFEQLGDFINDYFEIYLPWVFGTIIIWTNHFLLEEGAESLVPNTVPANIRWGVNTPVALELMVNGIQSRNLALRIADAWDGEEDNDVRSWIRSMGLVEWQHMFEASVAELRNLLEFSRDHRGGVAVDLITKESTELRVISNYTEFTQSDALLRPIEDTELSPVGVWVEDELVGRIHSRDQADIQSLLSTGLSFSIKFSALSGEGLLVLELLDPEV